jgi:stage II sporulation protein E
MMHYREWTKMPKGTVVTIPGGTAAAEAERGAGGGRGGLLAWLLAALVRPVNLPVNILAFLLGRVSIMGELAPFGLAFCAAVAWADKGRAPAAALAALAGMLSAGRFLEAGLYLAAAAMYVKAADRLTRLHYKLQAVPLYVFAVVVAGGALAMLWHRAPLYGLLLVFFDAVLCVALTYIFMAALPLVTGRQGERTASGEAVTCLVVMLAAAAAGFGELAVAGFSLRNVAGSFTVMLLAFAGGAGLGAAAGVAVGLVAGVAAGGTAWLVALYGVAGLVAAAGRSLGKAAVIAGFLLGSAIAVLQFTPRAELAGVLAEGAAAAAAFAAVPIDRLRWWRRDLADRAGGERAGLPAEMALKLGRVADIFVSLAATVGRQAAKNGAKVRDEELGRLLATAGEKLCNSCRRRPACRGQDYERTCQALEEALTLADKVRLTSATLPEPLKERCERGRELAELVNLAAERNRALSFWDKKAAETRLLAAEQMKAVAAVIRSLAGEVGRGDGERPAAATRLRAGEDRQGPGRAAGGYRVTTGWASAAKERVSGDTAAVLPLPGGRVAMVLSDGMGTGSRAAGDSAATVRYLERLLTAGFAVDVAVKTVNSLLLLKLPEESFTTVDMAVIDTASGEAEFLKVGAVPSFVKRQREVAAIKAAALPVGIMQQVEVEPVRWLLAPGDVIVLASDGVVEAGRGGERESWLANFLRRLPDCPPQELAERILRQAAELAGPCPRDDMTVLVARVAGTSG